MDQVRHPPISKDPVQEETEVPEPQQLPIVSPQPKPMVLEQPLPQVLHNPRPMPLPKIPDKPVSFQSLINPRPCGIRLLCTVPGYDNDIDDEK